MKRNKSFMFRIYPNESQKVMFEKTFGCVRFIYNKMLSDKIQYYEETKKMLKNTPAQYKKEYEWLKEVDSLALANAQLHLESAYKNFFRRPKAGYPKYKSKHKGKRRYTTNYVNGNIRMEDGYITLPKIRNIRIKAHRDIPEGYRMKSVTVEKRASGNYYVSILCEYEIEIKEKEINTSIGLDYSMGSLYVSSEDERADYPHFYRISLDRVKREQRRLSKMKKGGSNYQKQKVKIARLHEKITNQRKDFLHKKSRQIANAYDLVCIEDLDMKGMSRSLHFGMSVHDNGWGMFTTLLQYKLEDMGKRLVKVDRWFASTQICHVCGYKNADTKNMSITRWECPKCHEVHDRDYNASINIKKEGMRFAFE